MIHDPTTKPTKPVTQHRCVVLVQPQQSLPNALLAGLWKRSVPFEVVTDPVALMLAMARGGVGTVVVERPGETRRLRELVEAVRRFYPKAACWRYDPGDSNGKKPTLSHLDLGESRIDRPNTDQREPLTHNTTCRDASQAKPKASRAGRTGGDLLDDDSTQPDSPLLERNQPLLTGEELDMLLDMSDEPDADTDHDEPLEDLSHPRELPPLRLHHDPVNPEPGYNGD